MEPTLRIGDQWIVGEGPEIVSNNPATGEVVWRGATASASQVQHAVECAALAWKDWWQAGRVQRMEVARAYGAELTAGSEELAQLITAETGKPLWESRGEVSTCIAKVGLSIRAIEERWPAVETTMGEAKAEVAYRPLGVVLVLGPFNFPAHLPGGQMIPALLAGNAIVFKPSELTPAVGEWLVAAWERAGLAPGVLNLVQGGRDVAEAALDQTEIGGVMFTGSHRAGVAIHRRLAGRPAVQLTLEMGGNNPLIAVPEIDADLDRMAGAIVASAYITAGQRCTCARRLIVIDDAVGRALVDRLVQRLARLRVGLPGSDPEPFLGPLISSAAAASLLHAQAEMNAAGGSIIVEMKQAGECDALLTAGLIDMTDATWTVDEEYFGPLLQLYRVADFDAAIATANRTRFGLAAALLGGTADHFEQLRRESKAGVVNWNRQTTGASGALPFGGLGDSGNHRPAGYWAIDACGDPVASILAETIVDDSFDRMQL